MFLNTKSKIHLESGIGNVQDTRKEAPPCVLLVLHHGYHAMACLAAAFLLSLALTSHEIFLMRLCQSFPLAMKTSVTLDQAHTNDFIFIRLHI